MPIRIVTDSASDLPQAVLERYAIEVVPLYINVGVDSWLDGVDISHEEFYRRLPGFQSPPTTSAPPPASFIETYRRLAHQGATGILSIHISASLSNTVNAARLAAQELESLPITVVDAGQLSFTTGWMVMTAAEAIAAGASVAETVASIEEMGTRSYTFAALETLDYIHRSGRLSGFAYGLGTWLKIRPILKMYCGKPAMERVRTDRKAMERVIQLVAELGPLEHLSVIHTAAPDAADALRSRAASLFPLGKPTFTVEATPVIGSHIGPGVLGFAAVTARKG